MTLIVTWPWSPAAGPAMSLLTSREPVAWVYVSVMCRVAVPPAGTVTDVPLSPLMATLTVLVLPSAVSVALHVEPAADSCVSLAVVPGRRSRRRLSARAKAPSRRS